MRSMAGRKQIALFVSAIIVFLVSATAVAGTDEWKSVNEFTGWIRIYRKVDYQTTIATGGEEDAVWTTKDDSYAYIQATGTEFDGAYYRSTGRITGQINIMISLVGAQSGWGVERCFSGDINKKYSGKNPVSCPEIIINE